ncbi:MAG TPA: DegT/DnrJ/EryC1/StrS aminotransferase family protein [Methanolinea sp.]|jgi:perosamine synthetase|nr:DegT/DnrJ/EryC1/StrS aminotransferase family protein [Methanolinea sp.]
MANNGSLPIKYPVYQPDLSGNEKKYVADCIDSSWISSKGKYIDLFEKKILEYTKIKYGTTVCNGTIALHLALKSLGLGPGDEVIVPTLTYIASVNMIAEVGATPVFVDSSPSHWQMDVEDVKRKITQNTKAIMAVHLYGHPCDMDDLVQICADNNLLLIEDCAEAIGSLYRGKHVGSFGDIATFSFYGNKSITTGEGGMVVCSDYELYKKCVHLKTQGVTDKPYWHDVLGYNYRMTNICAAIGLAQMEKISIILEKKRNIALWYKKYLSEIPVEFHEEIGDVHHSYWMCSILVNDASLRDPLREHLAKSGIETRPIFYPAHLMPMYNTRYGKYPHACSIGARGINLPSYPMLTEKDIQEICECIRSFFSS